MEKFKKIILKNGLRIILIPQPSSVATTVAVLVEAGSKYETKAINGISHFLEHMCFKGTIKRPRPIDIAGELDSLGAHYNAFTSREFTSYFAKVRNDLTSRALNLVADLYLNPTFKSEEIEKEKGVIIEEINMYEDTPARNVQEIFMRLVYGDQPAGWDVAGTKEIIKSLKREDFIKYRGEHYLPQSTVVVVTGNFDNQKIIEEIENYFSVLPSGAKFPKLKVKEEQMEPQEIIKFKESDQTHLVMGFRAFDIFDKRRFALEVLSDILGGGMGSRLFQSIREELGAAYYVNASSDFYSDHGLVVMSAGVDHKKLEDVIKIGLQEFNKFKEKKVSEEELQRAKDHLTGTTILSIETSDSLGYYYGGQEIMGLGLETPEELLKNIQAVTSEEIQLVAQNLFSNNHLNLALIGPFKDKSFRDIIRL